MNNSVCLDFLPTLNEENPDASFMHESIENYCEIHNAEIIDESIKDLFAAIAKKLKSIKAAAWKKVKSALKHFKPESTKSSSGTLNEGIIARMIHKDGPERYKRGLDVYGDYIEALIIHMEEIAALDLEYIKKGFKATDNEKLFDSEFVNRHNKLVDEITAKVDAIKSKYGIPKNSPVFGFISDELINKKTVGTLNRKDAEEIVSKHGKRIATLSKRLYKFGKDSVSTEGELYKIYTKLMDDRHDYAQNQMNEFIADASYLAETYNITVSDVQGYLIDAAKAVLAYPDISMKLTNATKNLTESVGPRSVYYRLGESEVYKAARNQETVDGAKLESNITRMVRNGHGFTFVGYDDLDGTIQYEVFESNQFFNVGVSGTKKAMKNLVASGKVQMVYSDTYMVDVSIPFVVTTGHMPRVFVNISHFVSVNQMGKYVISQARNKNGFVAAIFAGAVAYSILSHYHKLNSDIGDPLTLMHSYMLTDVFDRLVHMDAVTRDKIRYLCTEFSLIQMYGTDYGNKTFQRFRSKYFPKLSPMIMDSIDAQFSLDAFDSLPTLVDEMVRIYPSMKKVTFKAVWQGWVKRYGSSAAMACDYIGYMIYVLSELLYESPLVNRLALDPILKSARGESSLKIMQSMVASVG